MLEVTEIDEDGNCQEFMLPSGPTFNMPYKGMWATQRLMVKLLAHMTTWGANYLTPEEIAEWQNVRPHLISRAMREGKVLYEVQS